jgi:wyosine [tRNA(Phe)-imidazoG37] synthetase (radical SAM superfamily)
MYPIYGPIPSWRLGSSLGVDLISKEEKMCSFNCIYCQLGETKNKTLEKEIFVETEKVEKNLREILEKVNIDVITFSGTGEPTLARNLGEVIRKIKKISDLPLAILTNSSLFYRKEMREELKELDIIVAKLDAPNQEIFERINQPAEGINFEMIVKGLKEMRKEFFGKGKKFSLQIMFIEENKDYAEEMASLAREIKADEVQINTPLRPCNVKPLGKEELKKIKEKFSKVKAISVYEREREIPKVEKINKEEILKRRPE